MYTERVTQKILFIALILGLIPNLLSAQAPTRERRGSFSLYFENDTFAGTDRCFTGGFKLGWISKDLENIKDIKFFKWLPFVNKQGFRHTFSLAAGQNIFTPDDITIKELIEDDRPYAGILYFAFGIHSSNSRRQVCWECNIGIIGPHSYAEEAQKLIHKVIRGIKPQGWQNQLKDELILQLAHERKWKFALSKSNGGFGFELIPHLGAGLGNAHIYTGTGMQIRLGWHLPEDFGTPLIRPGGDTFLSYQKKGPFSIHAFSALDGKAVLRNIFLDGNTTRDSHSVEKNPLTADLIIGVGMRIGGFYISYAYVIWTKKFKLEKREQVFGSLNLSYSY